MLKIAAFLSHPTQFHSAWFRVLARRPEVRLKVFFFSRHGAVPALDHDFGQEFAWDIPVTQGYDHEFLPTVPGLKDTHLGRLRLNRGIRAAVCAEPWDAILNVSYSSLANWVVWHEAQRRGIPLVFQGDSTLLQPRSRWRRVVKDVPLRTFFRGIRLFLACGDQNRDYFLHYSAPPDSIAFCPLPVEVQRFQRAKASPDWEQKLAAIRKQSDFSPEDRIALFCGKIIDYKRPLDLVAAVAQLNHPRLKAFFVGAGPLEMEVRRALPDKVRVTGFINQSEIPYYLGVGSVLVMPSVRDSHPMVVTEAASLGLPAIISDRCGCYGPHDILRPGENGLVYPCADVPALARDLKLLLLDDEDLRRRFSARALELAATQDVTVAAEALLQAVAALRQR